MKKAIAVFAITLLGASSALALPALQLGPGTGSWTYDTNTQTWVTDTNPFSLFAYANATMADGGNGDFAWDGAGAGTKTAYLVVSAVPMINFDGFDVTVENDGGALAMYTSGYGAAPLQDPNSLAPHGIFNTYFEIYEFQYDGGLQMISDTQPLQTGTGQGYAEQFDITLNSLANGVTGVHMDLFVVQGDGTLDLTDSNNNLVNSFAPFSHDAEHAVPEPGSLILLGLGIAGIGAAKRRKSA